MGWKLDVVVLSLLCGVCYKRRKLRIFAHCRSPLTAAPLLTLVMIRVPMTTQCLIHLVPGYLYAKLTDKFLEACALLPGNYVKTDPFIFFV